MPGRLLNLDPGLISHRGGHCFIVGLPDVQRGDSEDCAVSSRLRLFEEGTELGPAHVAHDTIGEKGGGRFSHWGGDLYFSTSDGGSPITNGRAYTVLSDDVALRSEEDRYLASKSGQFLAPNSELAAKLDELSKRSAMDRPLAFMHVPKTSGTALRAGLRETLPSTACIEFNDHSTFGAFRSFETMSPQLRQWIIETLPPANGIDLVMGHMAYSTLIQGRPAARLMTVLREPRSSILSLWMFCRSYQDEALLPYGAWGRIIRLSRQPLVQFLNYPEAACLTDNITVRMLLWPHPLIPDDGFINSASDDRLAREAAARLKTFDFADVVENPRLEDNIRAFLVRPFLYRRANESLVQLELRDPLEKELNGEALVLVEHRSRLDHELWRTVAAEHIAGADLPSLSDETFRRTVIRYAALMRPFVKTPGPITG